MSKNMRRALSVALVLCMAVAMFAGCQSKQPDSTQPSGDQPSTTPSATQPADAAPAEYTYKSYSTALGTNWNPHTWETNADDTILSYLSSPFCTMSIDDSENGVYQWIYEMATSIEDVTADHQDDLTKYDVTLPAGQAVEETVQGYVFEIKLNPDACWEDGTPINADSYIYSMEQLLDPDMKNYRANLYYAGESAVAGGSKYYFSKDAGTYETLDSQGYASVADALAAEQTVYIDAWDFWGAAGYTDAEGNECPQYVSVTDETVYGEAQNDAFSGASLWADYSAYLEVGASNSSDTRVYVANEDMGATFDCVGCYKVDDYTIRYVTQAQIDINYFLTSCTSTWLVYEPYYEAGKDTSGSIVTTNYGTSMANSMSYGPYKMESLQDGKQIVFVQNENWFGYEKQADGSLISYTNFDVDGEPRQQYQATKIVIDVMDDDAAKQAFLKGELSEWSPSADDLLTYATSDQLYKADETYTMSFFFNTGKDNLKTMDESKGNTNSIVLSNINFRKGFSLAIDRDEYVTATTGYKPNYALMNTLYFYDVYNDPTSSYRGSDEAMQAVCNLYGVAYGDGTPYATLKDAYDSINGYNLTEAQALMKQACDELVADGDYVAGEPIVIRIGWSKGPLDSAANNQVELMNKYINAAAEGSGFGPITLEAIGNVNDRYGDVANGEYAIGYGAWGGAAFYPFRNMQVYCDTEQYSINEAGCWDPATETLTINVEGEDVTMTWQEWSGALVGTGRFATVDNKVKLAITAVMEEEYLKKYYRIPLCSTTSCTMLSYQVAFYTEEYNIMYDFGGLRLMHFNYTDAEWAEFVAEQGGTLSYE